MPKVATKYYSNKQESMIADFLGWERVVGSGATACRPGDVTNGAWLGECKTHMSEQSRIRIQLAHWVKLDSEATSKFMTAALFVDNGMQQAESTYVVVSELASRRFILQPSLHDIESIQSKSSTSIAVKALSAATRSLSTNQPHAFISHIGTFSILVMTLADFRKAIGGVALC